MSSIFNILDETFGEILQKNGLEVPKTTAALAETIGVSAAQLSRIKNENSSLGVEVMNKIFEKIDKLEGDIKQRELWKERIGKAQKEQFKKNQFDLLKATNSTASSQAEDSLEEFHHRFFETNPDEVRLICLAYHDIPQSTDKGKHPEYFDRSAAVIKSGLDCAMFQFFGPLEQIKAKVDDAHARKDVELMDAWNYISKVAIGVHDAFKKTKAAVENGESKGQVVLYEASTVPSLRDCNIHSRLMYSEILGKNKIRVVQLVMGQDANKEPKEEYIECSTDSAFQSVIARQFHPILHCWRIKKGKLPTKDELEEFYNDNKEFPQWVIPKQAITSEPLKETKSRGKKSNS